MWTTWKSIFASSLALGTMLAPGVSFAQSPVDAPAGAYLPPQAKHAITEGKVPKPFNKHKKNQRVTRGPIHPNYKMHVTYDSQNHVINGKLSVTFTNNTGVRLNDVYFNLWGNAANFRTNGGGMDVKNVKVNGKVANHHLQDTALHIDATLPKNHKSTVSMDFTVHVPKGQDRFGWDGDTVSLGNWFPILAVYDDEGWNVDPYFPYGESFYSLTGNFDVTVTTDKKQVIAATGTEIGKPKLKGNLATHRYIAKQVRDFAMEMNPNYKIISTTVNKVKVNVYYAEEHAKFSQDLLQSGVDSMKLFSEKFGAYPWPELDVVSMKGWFGGMEYPQLVMISLRDNATPAWVRSVNAHEIGHQWFYGIIGNNEYDEAWLDESFATFAAALYDNELDQLTAEPIPGFHLSHPISYFTAYGQEGINAYYDTVYDYGARTLNDLRKLLGDKQFYASMQAYYKQKKFDITTTKDFIRIMEQTSGRDLDKFFAEHYVFVSDQE
jgi:hypothetical protein